jgi:Xaa-Pro aminopeptidase
MMEEQVRHDRVNAVRTRLMAERGLDMLLAYSDDPLEAGAVRYLTDFDVYAMYAVVMVPRTGDVVLAFGLHHSAYLIRVKDTASADYYLGTYQPGDLCRRLLSESGANERARIGLVGCAGMFSRIEADLHRSLPGASFIDVDEAFWALSDAEAASGWSDVISHLRRSAAICGDSVETARQRWRAAMSTCEIAADIGLAARRRGADILNREMVRVAFASGLPLPRHLRSEASSQPHRSDALAVEVQVAYRGLNTVAGRTFCNTDGLNNDLNAIHNAHRSLCRMLRTGTKVGAIIAAAAQVDGAAILTNTSELELGNRIGFSVRQQPFLRPGGDEVLPAMSAFVLNTRRTHPRLGTVRFADTVLVTDTSGEILTEAHDRQRMSPR